MLPEEKLKSLLSQVRALIPDDEFCGVGVVVHSSSADLPMAPLCSSMELPKNRALAEQIAFCSFATNICHDGFQFISADWELTHRNQYFAPFIEGYDPSGNTLENAVGARYMAAKFGSSLDAVLCTGLLSERDGLLVFVKGELV